ncbi:hypothetical protein [Streptomyces rishiriensis]|uniref:hypothetical protein n=1 Tax=Streptomyces rishiriensis TaxID=68264 RepID=UPI000D5912BE|nr:hypothetical protein [Streptomyces rishiriensis]
MDLQPAKDREPLRAAAVAVLVAAMAVGAALFGVAAEARPVLIGAFGMVAVTVVYGCRAPADDRPDRDDPGLAG